MERKSIVVVLGIIENKKGEILLSLRNDPKFKGAHLKWDLIGGKNEMGESLEKTLKREVLEETGLTVSVKNLLPHCVCKNWKLSGYFQHTLVFCYVCKKISGTLNSHDPKIMELKWEEPKSALKQDIIFSGKIFIELYLKEKKQKRRNVDIKKYVR